MDPKASVVITAHNRTKYIIDSVESVLNQQLIDQKLEIIVVKNFLDEKIDSFLLRNNVTVVQTDEVSFGKKLALGIDHASGDYICFLDDDDLFYAKKLSEINRIFKANKDLDYVHNNIEIIDENYKLKDDHDDVPDTNSYSIYLPKELRKINWGKLLGKRIDWYVSCISISLEFARKIRDVLWNNNRSLDKIIFLLSTNSRKICKIEDKLTFYRLHESTTGIKSTIENFQKDRLKFSIESRGCISSLINKSELPINKSVYNLTIFKLDANIVIYSLSRRYIYLEKAFLGVKMGILNLNKECLMLSILLFYGSTRKTNALKLYMKHQTKYI
jgi:glycosyltransferase involved in cell wall biosynthesis